MDTNKELIGTHLFSKKLDSMNISLVCPACFLQYKCVPSRYWFVFEQHNFVVINVVDEFYNKDGSDHQNEPAVGHKMHRSYGTIRLSGLLRSPFHDLFGPNFIYDWYIAFEVEWFWCLSFWKVLLFCWGFSHYSSQ